MTVHLILSTAAPAVGCLPRPVRACRRYLLPALALRGLMKPDPVSDQTVPEGH